jgi:hypothetical protein
MFGNIPAARSSPNLCHPDPTRQVPLPTGLEMLHASARRAAVPAADEEIDREWIDAQLERTQSASSIQFDSAQLR